MAIPIMEVVMTVATPEEDRIDQGFQIIGIGEKVDEIAEGKDPFGGGEGIVEEADEGVDQKNAEEGPDGGIPQKAADFKLRENSGLAHRRGGIVRWAHGSASFLRQGNSQGDLHGKPDPHFLPDGKGLVEPGVLDVHFEDEAVLDFHVVPDHIADIG